VVREPLANRTSDTPDGRLARLKLRLLRPIDYRAVIVGSLVADFIDKPLALWLAPEAVNHSTRSIAHSAVFAVALLLAALLSTSTWTGRLLVVSLCTAWHMVLDQMWRAKEIALWPAYGWSFPAVAERTLGQVSESYLRQHLEFYKDPWATIGLAIIALLLVHLARHRHYGVFIRSGTLR
jgi:hypothetical protein